MVVVTADGRRAFVANIGSGNVTAVDLAAGKKLADVATGAGAEGIALAPGGRELWVGNRAADTLSVVDPESLAVVATVPCPGFPIRLAFTPDGSRLLVSAARSGEVVLFDPGARKELLRRKLDLSAVAEAATRLFGTQFGESPVPVGLVVAPDGETAWVAATQADAVVAVDPATLEVKGLLMAGREPDGMGYSALAASPASP
jgi:YVTN family beta-propeller protein